jgi:hypothetical protein
MTDFNFDNGFPSSPVSGDTLIMNGSKFIFDGVAWDIDYNLSGDTTELLGTMYTKPETDSLIDSVFSARTLTEYVETITAGDSVTKTLTYTNTDIVVYAKQLVGSDYIQTEVNGDGISIVVDGTNDIILTNNRATTETYKIFVTVK